MPKPQRMVTGSSLSFVFRRQKRAFSLQTPECPGHSPEKDSTNQGVDIDALGSSTGKAGAHRTQHSASLTPNKVFLSRRMA